MFKKLFLILGLIIFLVAQAHAATYYWSNSTGGEITVLGNDSNPCSLAAPCLTLRGTSFDNTDTLSPDDILYFDGGDTWTTTGIPTDEIVLASNGTSTDPIIVSCYSASAGGECTDGWVKFYGAPVTTGFVQVGSTSIWTLSGQSQTNLKIVTQESSDCPSSLDDTSRDDSCALGKWGGSTTTLPEGTFLRSGTTLYVNVYGTSDPNTVSLRVAVYGHSLGYSDGTRGFISSTRTSGITKGKYITWKRIWVHTMNGVGASASAVGNKFENCRVTGSGMDGVLAYVGPNTGTATELGDQMRWYGTVDPTKDGESASDSIVEWSAMCSSGCGQGATWYAGQGAIYNTVVRNNGMAGIDMLNTNETWTAGQYLVSHNLVYNNGRQQTNPSYDPNIYNDGATNGTIIGNIVLGGGTVSGATNARGGISIGSEHNLDRGKVAHDIDVVGNLIYKNHNNALKTDNAGSVAAGADTNDIYNIRFIGNTLVGYDAGSFEKVFTFLNVLSSANTITMRNNIIFADNSATASEDLPTDTTFLDSDYNLWYRRGGSTTLMKVNGTSCTLSTWQAGSGTCGSSEDASSLNADPLLVSDSESTINARLKRTAEGYASNSPAIDVGMVSAWTPQAYLSTYFSDLEYYWTYGGTTRVDNALDDMSAPDIGFHYPTTSVASAGALTSTNIQPASLIKSSVGNVVFTFQIQQAWPANAKLVATFSTSLGSGFTFNSGSSTTASCTTNCDGSIAVGIASNVITLTRSSGTQVAAGTLVTVTGTNIQVPTSAGSTGTYALKTTTSADVTIDEDTSIEADTILEPSAGTLTITSDGIQYIGDVWLA